MLAGECQIRYTAGRMRIWSTLMLIGLAAGLTLVWPQPARVLTVAERTAGYILIQTEKNGEAWYNYPKTLTRYFLGRPSDAFDIMRRLGLGISDANLAKIPMAGSSEAGDAALRAKLSGYILIQVEKNGEAWYVYPKNRQRYYLGRPSDAFEVMRSLGLGISDADLAQITVDSGIVYKSQVVATSRGTFAVSSLLFDRKNPAIRIMTDTASTSNCSNKCPVYSLGTYVTRWNGLAGIHGTYFCPAEYPSCAGQTNFYFFPVYNSFSKVFINADRIKYTAEPMVVFDTANQPFFFLRTDAFKSAQDIYAYFAERAVVNADTTGKIRAALSNGPPLVYQGENVVGQNALDTKQATVKSYRGALAWKGDNIFLIVVSGATVTDSAAVMAAMGMDYALNLDGGGSTALYNAGRYLIGPGRNLPNAIVIAP